MIRQKGTDPHSQEMSSNSAFSIFLFLHIKKRKEKEKRMPTIDPEHWDIDAND